MHSTDAVMGRGVPPGLFMRERHRSAWVPWVLGAAIVIAAAIRFSTLCMQSYHHDEAWTAGVVLHSNLFTTLDKVSATESTPPLYYLLAWGWTKLFGTGEWGPRMRRAFTPGDFGHAFYPSLEVRPGDLTVRKTRFSAFIQGASDLDAILRKRGIDTVIIVGTATNICCESTARDAMMLNYKVFFVSDANACDTDEEHNATLGIMMVMFADVRATDEMIALLRRHAAPVAGAAE